jgi:hypothetical protein
MISIFSYTTRTSYMSGNVRPVTQQSGDLYPIIIVKPGIINEGK